MKASANEMRESEREVIMLPASFGTELQQPWP